MIGSPFKPRIDIPHVWVQDPPKKKGDYWAIYKSYNAMLRKAKGDLIVTMQDYTFTPPDTLERFLFHYKDEPKTIVGAVGNKYADTDWKVKTWQDPRERADQGTYYQSFFNDVELNLSAFPKQSFYDVGGFGEDLDAYSSLCGLDVLERLDALGGWDFKLDQSIKSYSTEHGRLKDWDKHTPFNGGYEEVKRQWKEKGWWPKLPYLK